MEQFFRIINRNITLNSPQPEPIPEQPEDPESPVPTKDPIQEPEDVPIPKKIPIWFHCIRSNDDWQRK